jgi:hypothetical protein
MAGSQRALQSEHEQHGLVPHLAECGGQDELRPAFAVGGPWWATCGFIGANLDIGRPSQVSLVFDRRVSRRTPGRFRTRVITDGVVPSLHVDYKKTRIKQYPRRDRRFAPRHENQAFHL